jgi:hypothetical protein
MHYSSLLLAIFIGGRFVLAAPGGPVYSPTLITDYNCGGDKCPPPTPTYSPPPDNDCGDDCGGVCGDKIVQKPYEDCDLGPALNVILLLLLLQWAFRGHSTIIYYSSEANGSLFRVPLTLDVQTLVNSHTGVAMASLIPASVVMQVL